MSRKRIDPFARKMIQGSLAFACVLVVMFAVLTVVYLHSRPRCSDSVIAEATSSSKKWTAALMERRCGEDTPFFTHVNILPTGQHLQRGFFSGSVTGGKVFEIEQDMATAGVNLQWSAPETLVIVCSRCQVPLVRRRDEQWNGVKVEYQLGAH